MTKKEMFGAIREVVADNADMVAFIDHEIELLNKKAGSKKMTKTQEANVGIKAQIVEALKGFENGATVTEILGASENFAGMSNQKVTALLRQLVESGEVVKTVDKKKAFFKVA